MNNRDWKLKSFLSLFLHPIYSRRINTEAEKWRRSRTQYFFFLLIYFRAGTPTITVEGSGLDMDSISVVSSIAPSHMYQCKCPNINRWSSSLPVRIFIVVLLLSLSLSLFCIFSLFLFPLNRTTPLLLFSLFFSVSVCFSLCLLILSSILQTVFLSSSSSSRLFIRLCFLRFECTLLPSSGNDRCLKFVIGGRIE